MEDKMKRIISLILVAVFAVIAASCGKSSTTSVTDGDKSLDFSLRWGVFGISSYNSKTGELIKTTDVIERSPDEYKTTFILSDEQRGYVSKILTDLKFSTYPDEFDPYMNDDGSTVMSSPSSTIILTVGDKTISCRDISLVGRAGSEMGERFLTAVGKITELLTSSEQWKALPEYEVLYD